MTRQKKSEHTRQTILDTGRTLVATAGFGAVGLATLLKESGVPKGSFYYYFASKDAFGQAMLEDYVADYLARVDALLDSDRSGGEKLLGFATAWLNHECHAGLASTCLVVKLAAEVADMSDDMRRVLDEGVQALETRLAAMLRQGASDGSIQPQADPEAAAQTLYAQLLGAAILSKLSQDQLPLERVLVDIKARLITDAQEGQIQ